MAGSANKHQVWKPSKGKPINKGGGGRLEKIALKR